MTPPFLRPKNESRFINHKENFMRSTASTIIIAVGLLINTSVSAQTLSLKDAVGSALKNNEKLKQYEERVEEKTSEDRAAWGNFLPKVELDAGYTHLNNPLTVDLDPIRQVLIQLQAGDQTQIANIYNILQSGQQLTAAQQQQLTLQNMAALNTALPPFSETFKKEDYPNATWTAVQPIFVGGKLIAAKRAAAADRSASENDLEKTKNELIQETVNNYLAVVLMNQVVKTRLNVLAGMEKHRQDAERLMQEGLIPKYQLLRAEVAVADAKQNLTDDTNKRELALIALRHSIGVSDDAKIIVSDSLMFVPTNAPLNSFLETAQLDQPILKYVADKKTQADQKYVAERADLLPQVAAFGKYEMFPQYLSTLEPHWVVGVSLSMTIFNGMSNYNKLESASHLQDEVSCLQKETSRQIDLWVHKSYREMQDAQARYNNLDANLNLAQENLRVDDERFQTGLGSSTDLIDAQLILEKEQIDRLNALFDYYSSLTDLYVATGHASRILDIWKTL